MTDQTLLGVLNILRMDEGQGQTFMVKAILPDGKPRLVSCLSRKPLHELKNIVESNSRMLCFYVQYCGILYLCVLVCLGFLSYRIFCVSRNFVSLK